MSASLMAERDRLQEEVENMERALCVTPAEVVLLSSDSGTSLPTYLSILSRSLSFMDFLCLSLDDSDDEAEEDEAGQVT